MAAVGQPTWVGKVPTTGTVELRPDPRWLDSIGRHHAFETAIADLVDNSIDAESKHVLIRFVRHNAKLISLLVVDDGSGMTDPELNIAMTVGGHRRYKRNELGRFGLGLKAASFSQAKTLVVASRPTTSTAHGRRWHLAGRKDDFMCEIVDEQFATDLLDRDWALPESSSGTVVRWDDVSGFPGVEDDLVVDGYLTQTIEKLRTHLGLTFHRMLERGVVSLFVDVEDVASSEDGLRYAVEPLDPFNYLRSGRQGYPISLASPTSSADLVLDCHIWPGRSTVPEFNLPGGGLLRQGFYVYLRDRLIQTGGWNGVKNPDKRLSLARVSVDIDGDVAGVLTLKPEKTGIEPGPQFAAVVHAARDHDGATFSTYLEDAEATYRDSRKRHSGRTAVIPPGRGLSRRLRRAIRGELRFVEGEEPIQFLWERFDGPEFFEIDRDQRVVWLNRKYRSSLLGGRYGSMNDLPVLKAALYLLLEDLFKGQHLGPRDKDNIELWTAILTAAAEAETE
jgi:hypothetical protein